MSVNMDNARTEDQKRVMEKFQQSGRCPFCLEELHKLVEQPRLFENDDWSVIQNRWPYEHLLVHLLVIPKRHVEKLSEVLPHEFVSLLEAIQWAEKKFGIISGAIAMRFGDPAHNGASVNHLHVHFMAGNGCGKCRIKVAQ